MKSIEFDPRTKLLIVACLSSLAVLVTDWFGLLRLLIVSIGFGCLFGVPFQKWIKRISRVLVFFLGLIVIQSLFVRDGNPILAIQGFALVTDTGLQRSLGYLFRVLIIFMSGMILATSSMRDLLQALHQLKLPYEIGLMVAIGVKFLPIFMQEVQDAFLAMQLRGIDIHRLPVAKRIQIFSYLFIPLVGSTINKAERLSETIESRGFQIGIKRTQFRKLQLRSVDWICMGLAPLLIWMVQG